MSTVLQAASGDSLWPASVAADASAPRTFITFDDPHSEGAAAAVGDVWYGLATVGGVGSGYGLEPYGLTPYGI